MSGCRAGVLPLAALLAVDAQSQSAKKYKKNKKTHQNKDDSNSTPEDKHFARQRLLPKCVSLMQNKKCASEQKFYLLECRYFCLYFDGFFTFYNAM